MTDWIFDTVQSGSLVLAVPVAVAAGLVSFFSPCVIPLLPGYMSYITGLAVTDLDNAKRGRMLAGSVLFVLGFSVVFVTAGTLFGAVGAQLTAYQRPLSIGMGVVIIILGLAFIGWIPFLQREWRIHAVPAVGIAVAPLIGALFGLGWLPCIGPALGAVLSLSLGEADTGRGAFLALAYCLGLGIPFVLAALGFARFMRAVSWFRKHQRAVSFVGGGMLIIVGLMLVTGTWDSLVFEMRGWVTGFETPL